MKKQYTVVALLLVMAMVLTGCSWKDVKSKFFGNSEDTATGGAVQIEDYDATKCVTLGEYRGIEVDCSVTDDEVQTQIDTELKQNATTKKIKKGKCKDGQTVNINYTGKIDGKEFEGGTAEDTDLELGSNSFIEGFEDGVVGMKVGETKELKLKFPDDYKDSSVAGKDVVFTVKLNYISKTITPKLTEKYVKEYTGQKTIAAYKKSVKESLATEKQNNAATTAFNTLVSNSKVNDMPATLKEAERQQIDTYNRKTIESYYGESTDFDTILGSMGMTTESYNTQLDSSAESSTTVVLIVEAISAKEGFEPSDADMQAYKDEVASSAGVTLDEYKTQYESYYGTSISFEDFLRTSYLYDKVMTLIQDTLVIK